MAEDEAEAWAGGGGLALDQGDEGGVDCLVLFGGEGADVLC